MKYWVFDLDGTLIDSFDFYLALVKTIFGRYGVTLAPENLNSCLGQYSKSFFASHLPKEHLAEALTDLKNHAMEDAGKIQPYQGILPLLTEIAAREMPMALWTSRDLESATKILDHTGLSRFFSHKVSGSCVGKHKPDPEGLLKIAGYFGCTPSQLVMVGDHDYDVQAAKAVGATAIRASWHRYEAPDFCSLSDHHFKSVDELLSWVR